jgi:hypothetical protein
MSGQVAVRSEILSFPVFKEAQIASMDIFLF